MDKSVVNAVHSALIFFGWAVLLPIALYVASFERNRIPNWTVIYQGISFTASAILSVSYVLYMTMPFRHSSNAYTISTHILMACLLLYITFTVIIDHNLKTLPNRIHRISGYLLMFSGLALVSANISDQPWADASVGIAWGLYLLTIIVVFLWAKMHVDLEREGHLQPLVIGPPPSIIVIRQQPKQQQNK